MSISAVSVTVHGTSCPWAFRGTGSNNATTANTVVAFASGFNDGTTAGGAAVGLNTAYRYGQTHTTASESNPDTVAVTPGQTVLLKYLSGTVQTQASGAGNSDPTGSTGNSSLSLGPNETSSSGYSFPSNFINGSTTRIGGLCGVFTDASGVVIAGSFFDWKSRGGTSSANSFIQLTVPVGAAFLSLGINDDVLHDNTGSFSMTAFLLDSAGWFGDRPTFARYPVGGPGCAAFGPDHSSTLLAQLFLTSYWMPQSPNAGAQSLIKDYVGQLFPHGGNASAGSPAGVGQNFPY